jgi:hypothetical protein
LWVGFGWFVVRVCVVKKSLLLLLVVSLFGFVGCGSGGGDEAEGRTRNVFLEDSYVAEFDGDVESCARYVRKYSAALEVKNRFDLVDVDSAFDLGDMADLIVFYYGYPEVELVVSDSDSETDSETGSGSGVVLGDFQYLLGLEDQYGLVEETANRGFVNVFGMFNESSFGRLLGRVGFAEGKTAVEINEFISGIELSEADSSSMGSSSSMGFGLLYAGTEASGRYGLLEAYGLLEVLGIVDVSDLLDLSKIFDVGELNDRRVDRYGQSWTSVISQQSAEQGFEVTESQLADILEVQALGKLFKIYEEMNDDGLLDELSSVGDFKERVEQFQIIGNLAFMESLGMFDYVSFSQNLDELDCQLSAGTGEAEAVVQSFDISTGSPTCESFATQLEAQTWFDLNAFADFELRTELDPDNTDVACNHEGSPLRVIPEETEAGSDTNTTETELPACTEDNQGQWAKQNWEQQKEPLTFSWGPGHYWENFQTSFIGWTYEAWQCSMLDGQKILTGEKINRIGFGPGWKSRTTVWSPFPPDFIPAGFARLSSNYVYPTKDQLNALGPCVIGEGRPDPMGGDYTDLFIYSYLESDISYFNAPWFHALIRCTEGELVKLDDYEWGGPSEVYPNLAGFP